MEFSNEIALLQEIWKGAQMGTESIRLLLPKVKNAAFRSDLQTQYEQYDATGTFEVTEVTVSASRRNRSWPILASVPSPSPRASS